MRKDLGEKVLRVDLELEMGLVYGVGVNNYVGHISVNGKQWVN